LIALYGLPRYLGNNWHKGFYGRKKLAKCWIYKEEETCLWGVELNKEIKYFRPKELYVFMYFFFVFLRHQWNECSRCLTSVSKFSRNWKFGVLFSRVFMDGFMVMWWRIKGICRVVHHWHLCFKSGCAWDHKLQIVNLEKGREVSTFMSIPS